MLQISGLTLGEEGDVKPLFEDRFVVVAGAQKKVGRRKSTLADLVDERSILTLLDGLPGMIAEVFHAEGLDPPQAHVVSFSIPLHQYLLASRGITLLPMSMLHFGTSHEAGANCHHRKRYLIGIVALKYRTLAPFAQIFMDRALEIAKSFAKFAKDSMHRDLPRDQ